VLLYVLRDLGLSMHCAPCIMQHVHKNMPHVRHAGPDPPSPPPPGPSPPPPGTPSRCIPLQVPSPHPITAPIASILSPEIHGIVATRCVSNGSGVRVSQPLTSVCWQGVETHTSEVELHNSWWCVKATARVLLPCDMSLIPALNQTSPTFHGLQVRHHLCPLPPLLHLALNHQAPPLSQSHLHPVPHLSHRPICESNHKSSKIL
jgi:hypothetical protein